VLSDPDLLYRRRNFAPISLSFRDLTRDRQTTDATTKTEGSHIVCEPNNDTRIVVVWTSHLFIRPNARRMPLTLLLVPDAT